MEHPQPRQPAREQGGRELDRGGAEGCLGRVRPGEEGSDPDQRGHGEPAAVRDDAADDVAQVGGRADHGEPDQPDGDPSPAAADEPGTQPRGACVSD